MKVSDDCITKAVTNLVMMERLSDAKERLRQLMNEVIYRDN